MIEIMTLRIPKEINDRLKTVALQKGITKNTLMLEILWAWADEKEKEQKKHVETN